MCSVSPTPGDGATTVWASGGPRRQFDQRRRRGRRVRNGRQGSPFRQRSSPLQHRRARCGLYRRLMGRALRSSGGSAPALSYRPRQPHRGTSNVSESRRSCPGNDRSIIRGTSPVRNRSTSFGRVTLSAYRLSIIAAARSAVPKAEGSRRRPAARRANASASKKPAEAARSRRLVDLANRLRVRSQYHASAGERVQHRPREDKRNGQVDVQVAQAQNVDQVVGRHEAGEDEHVVVVLRQHMLSERAMADVLLVAP